MGSNPILSANGNRINPVFMRFFHTYIAKRAEIEIPALLYKKPQESSPLRA